MIEAKEMVETFLKNFKYLNEKGKRSGFLLFVNKGLTASLENNAKKLQNDLKTLISDDKKSDLVKQKEFFDIVEQAFVKTENDRDFFSTPITKAPDSKRNIGKHRNTQIEVFDYKFPYQPSKFEDELLKGLISVKNLMVTKNEEKDNENASWIGLQAQCGDLIREISTFKHPIKVSFKKGSPAPGSDSNNDKSIQSPRQ